MSMVRYRGFPLTRDGVLRRGVSRGEVRSLIGQWFAEAIPPADKEDEILLTLAEKNRFVVQSASRELRDAVRSLWRYSHGRSGGRCVQA